MNASYCFILWTIFGLQHSFLARPFFKKFIKDCFGENFQKIAIFNCKLESLQKASNKHDDSVFILADENRYYFDMYNLFTYLRN